MFFTCLGTMVGAWLLFTPLLVPGRPLLAGLAVVVGAVAIVGGVFGIALVSARRAVALGGLLLAMATFTLVGDLLVQANLLASALAVLVAGLQPIPRVVSSAAAAVPVIEPLAEPRQDRSSPATRAAA